VALPVREGAFMSNEQDKKQQAHLKKMEALKENIDASIAAATIDRGVGILLTGNGKGKSSSAFGMVMRALGYEYKVGVVQFIKGQQLSGEEIYVREQCPSVTFHQMNTGFTWDTQDRSSDIVAAKTSWAIAEKMLKDDSYHLVVLDELTYMISFDYLDEDSILSALKNRPENQSVVVTGRGGGSALTEWADTVSEIKEIKHAYNEGVMARKGVDL
jgi:cob(I)alamin adenosyltransferase|tara:strand:+ start:1851 stop:2495 length:645 start_codon:yes stop_codon:yes gene_type:complete